MRFNVLQDNFKRGLSVVGQAVAGKSTLPVLSNVLIRAGDNQVKLSATNLEIGITHKIGAMIEVDGAVTVPYKLLSDVVNGLPNGRVLIELDAKTQTIKIECGRFKSNIKGIEADEYPAIPAVADNPVTFAGKRLAGALKRVVLCAADDDSRPVLAGVMFKNTGGKLMLAAADGYRVAVETIEGGNGDYALIIPARALDVLAKLMSEAESIHMHSNNAQVSFVDEHGATTLVSRLIDGQYPDVMRIIPQTHTTRAVVEVADLAKHIKLASYFSVQAQNVVKLTSEANEDAPGKLTISANAAEVGDNTSDVDAMVSGEGGPIAVNVKYLQELLAVAPTAQIAIETQSPQSPFVMRPVGFDGEYVTVIMPMAIR